MPLPAPSKPHGNVRINVPRFEDRKIERLLARLATKMKQASQSVSTTKKIA
jgi:hypothetical protein